MFLVKSYIYSFIRGWNLAPAAELDIHCTNFTIDGPQSLILEIHTGFRPLQISLLLIGCKSFQSWKLKIMISLIPVGLLILRLIIKGKQALFNLEIKKKSGSSINPNIHHSKVPSSGLNSQASNSMVLTKKQVLRHSFSRIHRNLCAHLCTL